MSTLEFRGKALHVKAVMAALAAAEKGRHKYVKVRFKDVGLKTLLRLSSVARRRRYAVGTDPTSVALDVDIVQIVVNPDMQHRGVATNFYEVLLDAAKRMGRGVFVECCITPASMGWANKLVRNGRAVPYSPYPGYPAESFISQLGAGAADTGTAGATATADALSASAGAANAGLDTTAVTAAATAAAAAAAAAAATAATAAAATAAAAAAKAPAGIDAADNCVPKRGANSASTAAMVQ